MTRREVDILVLSDVHLGTYGCHARELMQYLKSIKPKAVVLNGDIIDIWQFSKSYFPSTHMMVVKHIIEWVMEGLPVYYITGNHDEMLRKFNGLEVGSLKIMNRLSLQVENSKVWFIHGDVFDVVMQNSRWLARLGAVCYDYLILVNRFVNFISKCLGGGKISLSKKIKNGVKGAVKFVNSFEGTISDIAAENKYDYVACGHIHKPEIRLINTAHGNNITYMNSGDWIESLTSLEYANGAWRVYDYYDDAVAQAIFVEKKKNKKESAKVLLSNLLQEIKTKK